MPPPVPCTAPTRRCRTPSSRRRPPAHLVRRHQEGSTSSWRIAIRRCSGCRPRACGFSRSMVRGAGRTWRCFCSRKNILAGQPIEVFNDGRHRRDFTYVDDIVEGVVRGTATTLPTPDPNWDSDASRSRHQPRAVSDLQYRQSNARSTLLRYHRGAGSSASGARPQKNLLPMQLGRCAGYLGRRGGAGAATLAIDRCDRTGSRVCSILSTGILGIITAHESIATCHLNSSLPPGRAGRRSAHRTGAQAYICAMFAAAIPSAWRTFTSNTTAGCWIIRASASRGEPWHCCSIWRAQLDLPGAHRGHVSRRSYQHHRAARGAAHGAAFRLRRAAPRIQAEVQRIAPEAGATSSLRCARGGKARHHGQDVQARDQHRHRRLRSGTAVGLRCAAARVERGPHAALRIQRGSHASSRI